MQKEVLATVSAHSVNGICIFVAGDNHWRWFEKGKPTDVHEGDRVGLLLESPPGSNIPCTPGPNQNTQHSHGQIKLVAELLQKRRDLESMMKDARDIFSIQCGRNATNTELMSRGNSSGHCKSHGEEGRIITYTPGCITNLRCNTEPSKECSYGLEK